MLGFVVCTGCVELGLQARNLAIDMRTAASSQKASKGAPKGSAKVAAQPEEAVSPLASPPSTTLPEAPLAPSAGLASGVDSRAASEHASWAVKWASWPAHHRVAVAHAAVVVILAGAVAALVLVVAGPDETNTTDGFRSRWIGPSLLLVPLGVAARAKLGAKLNPKRPPYFLGTLAGNLTAVALVAFTKAWAAAHPVGDNDDGGGGGGSDDDSGEETARLVLAALGTGFAGCLSTASTLASEVRVLITPLPDEGKNRDDKVKAPPPLFPSGAYKYAGATAASSVALALAIYAPLRDADWG